MRSSRLTILFVVISGATLLVVGRLVAGECYDTEPPSCPHPCPCEDSCYFDEDCPPGQLCVPGCSPSICWCDKGQWAQTTDCAGQCNGQPIPLIFMESGSGPTAGRSEPLHDKEPQQIPNFSGNNEAFGTELARESKVTRE